MVKEKIMFWSDEQLQMKDDISSRKKKRIGKKKLVAKDIKHF